jgi:ribonuclease P protein component
MASFTKQERLCSKKHIDALFKEGQSFMAYPYRVALNWVEVETEQRCKVVMVVSKRNFKRAHDRNRIKRQMRELWRNHKENWYMKLADHSQACHLGLIYVGKQLPEFSELQKGTNKLLKELEKHVGKATGTGDDPVH